MKKPFIVLLTLAMSPVANSLDLGGTLNGGNALTDVAKNTRTKMDEPIQVINLNMGKTIHIYGVDAAYFVDDAGNRIPVPDAQYQDEDGNLHTIRDGHLVRN